MINFGTFLFPNRQTGQDTIDEISRRDLRKELDERERAVAREKRGDRGNKGTSSSENVYFTTNLNGEIASLF